jgi:hypothetical protein
VLNLTECELDAHVSELIRATNAATLNSVVLPGILLAGKEICLGISWLVSTPNAILRHR